MAVANTLLFVVASILLWHTVKSSGCSETSDDVLKEQRTKNLQASIETQISGLQLTPYNASDLNIDANDTTLKMFQALQNTSIKVSLHPEKDSCQPGAFYAKRVSPFTGVMTPVDTSESGSRQSSLVQQGFHLLSAYRVDLPFSLEEQLRDISRADLLLHQEPTLTGPNIDIRDYQQYVEISTIIEGTRYFMEGKNIDTFSEGNQVFDITNAVRLWLDNDVQGNVSLEVGLYCSSSPFCAQVGSDGRIPAKVKFLYSLNQNLPKDPWVLVVSSNPLEMEAPPITKRSADEGTEFCSTSDNNNLCCLKPLTINFKNDLRMNNVILPETFEANYCQGVCPSISSTALLTSQRYRFLRLLGTTHPSLSIEPCCAGAEYEDLDVLMKTLNRHTRRPEARMVKLQQVMVVRCRCA